MGTLPGRRELLSRITELEGALTALTDAVTVYKERGARWGLYGTNSDAIVILKKGKET